jgi:hypothetical protein
MRRSNTTDPREAKAISRKKYAERQIKKWVDWSWRVRGRVIYKELIQQIEKYEQRK